MASIARLIIFIIASMSMASCLDENYLQAVPPDWGAPADTPAMDTVCILAIGNSFAQDAMEYRLKRIFEANGIVSEIYGIPLPSASLALHLRLATLDSCAYYLRVADRDTSHAVLKCTMASALAYKDWDIVTVQQSGEYSGKFESYCESLPALIDYIRQRTSPTTRIALHQTWAYAPDCTREHFNLYHKRQREMYDSIASATRRAMEAFDIDLILPSGTAIQNARTTTLGVDLTRDGFHLDRLVGRYIAASTWFRSITGLRLATPCAGAPDKIDFPTLRLILTAVQGAITDPYEITDLSEATRRQQSHILATKPQ